MFVLELPSLEQSSLVPLGSGKLQYDDVLIITVERVVEDKDNPGVCVMGDAGPDSDSILDMGNEFISWVGIVLVDRLGVQLWLCSVLDRVESSLDLVCRSNDLFSSRGNSGSLIGAARSLG